MKKKLPGLLSIFLVLVFWSTAVNGQNLWTNVSKARIENKPLTYSNQGPKTFTLFRLDVAAFKTVLKQAAPRFSKEPTLQLLLPTKDGELQRFRVYQASVFQKGLQEKYPLIRSYAAQGVDDPSAVARFSVSPYGVHLMISSGHYSPVYIDPYTRDKKVYIVYTVDALPPDSRPFTCQTDAGMRVINAHPDTAHMLMSDDAETGTLHIFRLALACDHQYAQYHLNNQGVSPNASEEEKKTAVLSAMNTAMTRIDGIYERDMGLTLQLVDEEPSLIFLSADEDPYDNNDLGAMLSKNQQVCDSLIGSDNFDIGHVFGTAHGGLAYLGVVCNDGYKAQGATGIANPISDYFYVSYVAHEMGHQFGADHSFSGNTGGCQGNRYEPTAMEPGSGSTIMSYAGLCTGENIQGESDGYFHAVSLHEMHQYVNIYAYLCATNTPTNNTVPMADAGADYVIPQSTAFVLSGSAEDADDDGLTYTWDEMDPVLQENEMTQPPEPTNTNGPMFRSLPPDSSSVRYMPKLTTVEAGLTQNTYEVTSAVGRTLHFRLTVRDNVAGGGATNSDDMTVTVAPNSGPFAITSQNTATTWHTQNTITITWEVANSDAAPVNCQYVAIFFSKDGSFTHPDTLALAVPNNGMTTVPVPYVHTSQGRIMVKGADNIFFAINNAPITITGTLDTENPVFEEFSLSPNPTDGRIAIHFIPKSPAGIEVALYDIQGRLIHRKYFQNKGGESFSAQLDYADVSPGLYFIRLKNGSYKTIKKLIRK